MATLNQPAPEKPSDRDYAIIWYLQTLIRNDGQCNMFTMHGKNNSPNSKDIIWAQDYLRGQGYTRHLSQAIGVTYQITDKGRSFFNQKVYEKVLDKLVKSNDFMKVSSMLAELCVDDENNQFSKAITSQIKKNYKITSIEEDDSIMLTDDAKEKYLASKFVFDEEIKKPSVQHIQKIEKNYGMAMQDSQVKDLAFQPTHIPPTTPINPETKHGKTNAAIKFILNNIILIILLTVIGGLIVAYIAHWFGWNK